MEINSAFNREATAAPPTLELAGAKLDWVWHKDSGVRPSSKGSTSAEQSIHELNVMFQRGNLSRDEYAWYGHRGLAEQKPLFDQFVQATLSDLEMSQDDFNRAENPFHARMEHFNDRLNEKIEYRYDAPDVISGNWGSYQHPYATVVLKEGDCEDQAMIKYMMLQEMAVPSAYLEVRRPHPEEKDENGQPTIQRHAIAVAYDQDGAPFVLDNGGFVLPLDYYLQETGYKVGLVMNPKGLYINQDFRDENGNYMSPDSPIQEDMWYAQARKTEPGPS